jgi:hypothetical protein
MCGFGARVIEGVRCVLQWASVRKVATKAGLGGATVALLTRKGE